MKTRMYAGSGVQAPPVGFIEQEEVNMARTQSVDAAGGKGMVRFRMDEVLKQQTEKTLEQMGLSMASVVTMLVRRIVAEGKLPFEMYAVSTPQELTRAAMAESRAILRACYELCRMMVCVFGRDSSKLKKLRLVSMEPAAAHLVQTFVS